MSQSILTVDQVLTNVSGSQSPQFKDQLNDYVLGMVYANAAARSERNKVDNDPESAAQTFNNQWSNILGKIGWVLTSAGTTQMSSSNGQTTTIADRIKLLSGGSTSTISQVIDTLKELTESDNPDETELLELWWQKATQETLMQGSLGQLVPSQNGLSFEIFSFTIDLKKLQTPATRILERQHHPLDISSAKAMYFKVLTSGINITTSNLSAVLQDDVWATQKDEVANRVGSKVIEHYKTLPTDMLG